MNNRTRNIILALVFSLLFHISLFYLIDFFDWLVIKTQALIEETPKEVTVVFPENKPEPEKERYIIDNQNENELVPDKSNLLSDRNSQARNSQRTGRIRENNPFNKGNVNFKDLSKPLGNLEQYQPPGYKKFSANALTGKQVDRTDAESSESKLDGEQGETQKEPLAAGFGTNQQTNQQEFSVDVLGGLTLSTYAWEYAPYIRKLKQKFLRIWTAPPAWHMGLIDGQSVIYFEIDRNGNLIDVKTVDHKGHESLLINNLETIKALFPFIPLPDDFPEETLQIRALITYPNINKLIQNSRR